MAGSYLFRLPGPELMADSGRNTGIDFVLSGLKQKPRGMFAPVARVNSGTGLYALTGRRAHAS